MTARSPMWELLSRRHGVNVLLLMSKKPVRFARIREWTGIQSKQVIELLRLGMRAGMIKNRVVEEDRLSSYGLTDYGMAVRARLVELQKLEDDRTAQLV